MAHSVANFDVYKLHMGDENDINNFVGNNY